MSRRSAALGLAAAAVLAACGALDPFPTAPRVASGAGGPPRVGICYNTLRTTLAAVQQEAAQECSTEHPGSTAQPADTDWYLQNCPLLLPARATFICTGGK